MKFSPRTLFPFALLLSLSLFGCGSGADDFLTGTWKFMGGATTTYISFHGDGSATMEAHQGGELRRQDDYVLKQLEQIDDVYRVSLRDTARGASYHMIVEPQDEGVANVALGADEFSPAEASWPRSVAAAPSGWTKRKIVKQ